MPHAPSTTFRPAALSHPSRSMSRPNRPGGRSAACSWWNSLPGRDLTLDTAGTEVMILRWWEVPVRCEGPGLVSQRTTVSMDPLIWSHRNRNLVHHRWRGSVRRLRGQGRTPAPNRRVPASDVAVELRGVAIAGAGPQLPAPWTPSTPIRLSPVRSSPWRATGRAIRPTSTTRITRRVAARRDLL